LLIQKSELQIVGLAPDLSPDLETIATAAALKIKSSSFVRYNQGDQMSCEKIAQSVAQPIYYCPNLCITFTVEQK
jgi:hypothetical protein